MEILISYNPFFCGGKNMKNKNLLKAGIILAILFLILFISAESTQAAVTITSVTGGIGVTATITNSGPDSVNNVDWAITATGGWIIFRPTTAGIIVKIDPNQSVTIRGHPIGFGSLFSFFDNMVFTVTATGATPVTTPPGPIHLFLIWTW